MFKEKILIVEDSETLLTYYKGVLAPLHIKVDTAKSYDEAILKLKTNDYCFHIIDISLNGMTPGLEIIGKCGADPESCLILSSKITEEIISDLVDVYGVTRDMIMSKPVDVEKLINFIKSRIINKQNSETSIIPQISESEKTGLQIERLIFKHLYEYICKRKIATAAVIITFTVFMNFFISYLKVNAYNEIYGNIESRNEYNFRHFNNAQSVSNATFITVSGFELIELFNQLEDSYPELLKKSVKLNLLNSYIKIRQDYIKRVQIRFYPENNYLFIVIDDDKQIRQFWFSDRKYLESLGIGKKITFMDMILKAWADTFK